MAQQQNGQQRLSEQLTTNNRLSSGQISSVIISQQQHQKCRQESNDANRSSPAALTLASSPTSHHHHHLLQNRLTSNLSANQLHHPPHNNNNNNHHHHHNFKSHQRRQSVARLLPDISKLRLLSWLVEASSELIQCDVAIMDGVYAKLNKSQESLLFWTTSHQTPSQQHMSLPSQYKSQQQQQTSNVAQGSSSSSGGKQSKRNNNNKQQPALPSVLPVASSNLTAKMKHKHQKLQRATKGLSSETRSHHSLPLTNYDSSSLAAVSISPSLNVRSSIRTNNSGNNSATTTADLDNLVAAVCSSTSNSVEREPSRAKASTMPASIEQATSSGIIPSNNISPLVSNNNNNNEPFCDSNQSDDDDNSSAASSTTSSGIHGGGTSFSSASSSASSSGITSSSSSSASSTSSDIIGGNNNNNQQAIDHLINNRPVNSAELLSEKIRRTVMEHNYLQNLLVNVIRQHDRQRDIINQQRRRQMSFDQQNHLQLQRQRLCQQRIDLIDIAEALDDGCLCMCHSQPRDLISTTVEISESNSSSIQLDDTNNSIITLATTPTNTNKASTLPASTSSGSKLSSNQPSVPSRKVRRLKKLKGGGNNNKTQFNREDIINQLANKLCENCFETHYWLRGCPQIELMQKTKLDLAAAAATTTSTTPTSTSTKLQQQHLSTSLGSSSLLAQQVLNQNHEQDLNNIIIKRNATFIKLVQQEVRSTISKSIELIDLIRKEIKSPESIKQKHLMKCFSSSIQLLTSVGNYVVPAQDISSFIPEVGQQQTTLFRLPPSDFDHLLHYPPPPPPPSSSLSQSSHHTNQQSASRKNSSNNSNHSDSQYHLASAPDIPIRRRFNQMQIKLQQQNKLLSDSNGSLPTTISSIQDEVPDSNTQFLSLNLQRLRTSDNLTSVVDSSSGASSNNSSASSSIARGGVQQSSLTRAQTSSAILDDKTSRDLSLEAIANLTAAAGAGRQHSDYEDSMFSQSRPKFWQSSKFNFIKKLLHVKQQRLLRQQSKDRRIYNNKVQNKFRLVMMDLTHFNKSQQLLTTENGVNSLLTSMRNVLEFGLYLTLKLY